MYLIFINTVSISTSRRKGNAKFAKIGFLGGSKMLFQEAPLPTRKKHIGYFGKIRIFTGDNIFKYCKL